MKKIFLLTLSMFAVAIFASSCTKPDDDTVPPEDIIPSIECDDTIDAPYKGGTFTINVKSTVSWKASVDDSRITLSPTEGKAGTTTLLVKIPELLDFTPRQYTIILSNTEYQLTKEIMIQQGLSNEDLQEFTITYTTNDNKRLDKKFHYNEFNADIMEHTYENGKGRIVFDKPITKIGEAAFEQCSSLTSITIPNSVTSIGNDAFWECHSLTSITIPDGVTAIGYYAFLDCSSLKSINIPDGVTEIGSGAFSGCSSLTAFYGKYSSDDKRCLIKGGKLLIAFAPYGLTEYTIPNGVTGIGEEAFTDCSRLTSVTIPDSVTSIGDYAFWDCHSLTSVYCKPETPPTLDYLVFYCSNDNPYIPYDLKIYVPRASVEVYKSAKNWSEYASQIVGYDF